MWKKKPTILLNNQWVKGEITEEMKKYIVMNKNKNATYKNLHDTAKAVFRGKCVAVNAYIKKEERFQINNPTLQLKELEEEQS